MKSVRFLVCTIPGSAGGAFRGPGRCPRPFNGFPQQLLLILAEQGPLQSSQLADQAQLDRTRTSRNIASLAQKKLIERMPCTGHGRRTILAVTEAGRAVHAALFPQVSDINRALFAGLPDAEVDRLAHSLCVLMERAQAIDIAMDLPNAGRGLRRTGK